MTHRLEGCRILLTGASRGVGFETARRFLGEGAAVLGVAKDAERLRHAAGALAPIGDFDPLEIDLADRDAPECVAEVVQKQWGALWKDGREIPF